MAIRNLRIEGDPILRKTSKEVKEITPKIVELVDDMLETMYEANGVGLAAPQVGVLKRIVVIDVGEGPIVLINPEITRTEGSQTGDEGCLSVPGKAGTVTRPNEVTVRFMGEDISSPEIIRRADVVWIQTNCIGHKSYYNIIDLARRYDRKVRYFKYASASKCAEQIVEEENADE